MASDWVDTKDVETVEMKVFLWDVLTAKKLVAELVENLVFYSVALLVFELACPPVEKLAAAKVAWSAAEKAASKDTCSAGK